MFFAIGIVLHRVYAFGHSPTYSRNLGIGIFAGLTAIAIYHCNTDTSTVHQVSFLSMCLTVAWGTRGLIKGRVQNRNVRRKMVTMLQLGTGKLSRTGPS